MALLNDKEVKIMASIALIWVGAMAVAFAFTQASWLTLAIIVIGYLTALGYLAYTQMKPTKKKDIEVSISYVEMQAVEECILCDKPSQSAKSIARQWINKIRK